MTKTHTHTHRFLCVILMTISAGVWGQPRTEEDSDVRPNILLVLVDDLGWMDLRCQGNDRLDTPNIDRLAKDGMRFTDAYAAAPVCSPTRASILTGQSPARLQLTNHLPHQDRFTPKESKLLPAKIVDHVALECDTIAERLKRAGYATGFFGKWHVAGRPDWKNGARGDVRFYPEKQGFDVNVGGCAAGGPPSFFSPYQIHNLPDGPKGEYLPDRLASETISFVRKNAKKPWFVALWNYTVHWPMEAPRDLIAKYEKRKGPGVKDPRYAAMIEAMDVAFGRIMGALEASGEAKETLVVFTSDNGPFLGVTDAGPLRLGKGYLYEGGIRVPWIVRWPGVVKPGTTCSVPVVSTDLYPTLLEAAGVPVSPEESRSLDSTSIVSLLRGESKWGRDAIYFHYPNFAFHGGNRLGGAVRFGSWKLIEYFDDDSLELYDLATDLGESKNLANSRPEIAKRLHFALRAWRREVGAAMPRPRE